MSRHQIDYETLAQDAMRGLVRTVLQRVARSGLPGDHHFYISFHTRGAGVIVSKRLLERYPDEMTIVLQNKFSDLKAFEDRFEVTLWFDSIPERLVIPFTAVKVFFDPSVPFGHQFEVADTHAGNTGPHAIAAPAHGGRDGASGPSLDQRDGERPPSIAPGTPAPAQRARPAAKLETSKPAAKGPAAATHAPAPHALPSTGTPAPTTPASTKAQPSKPAPRPADIAPKKSASEGGAAAADTAASAPATAPAEHPGDGEEHPPSKVVALDAFRKKN